MESGRGHEILVCAFWNQYLLRGEGGSFRKTSLTLGTFLECGVTYANTFAEYKCCFSKQVQSTIVPSGDISRVQVLPSLASFGSQQAPPLGHAGVHH